MRREKTMAILRKFLPPLMVLLLLGSFFFYCRSRVQTEFSALSPVDGILDRCIAVWDGYDMYIIKK